MTRTLFRCLLALLIFGLSVLRCDATQWNGSIANRPMDEWVKAENGLILIWDRANAKSAEASMIKIFDNQGQPLVSFEILGLVPGATISAAHDVSAVRDKIVAVSATYVNGQNGVPAAVLLIFDFKGKLISATALDPSREISYLAVDDDSKVWTVPFSAGGKDLKDVPMVVEYDSQGNVAREVLTRNLFPAHATNIKQNSLDGAVAVGCVSDVFWVWLPSSTDLVEIRTKDGVVTKRTTTGLPSAESGSVVPLSVAREASGAIIAQVRIPAKESGGKSTLAEYKWSPASGSWTEINPVPCNGARLIGIHGTEQTYLRNDNSSALCTSSSN